VLAARVLIIGAGGLGCPAALYLAAAGVGTLVIVDGDTVDLTNLQRQIGHSTPNVGQSKVASLQSRIAELNPDVAIEPIARHADAALLNAQVALADVVLDCTDHFTIRHQINQTCVKYGVPLVSGAALRFDGQLTSFDFRRPDAPCYACIFPADTPPDETSCATMGVFSPTVGIVGAAQAAEALKLITGVGKDLTGRLLLLDSLRMEWNEIRLGKEPDCAVCGTQKLNNAQP
jgi:molybdopterin/thiamine biosynthesis adenylyltransferase